MCGRGPVENVTREVEVETTRTVSELVPVTKTVTTTVTKLVPVVQNKTVVVPRTTYTNETTVSVSPAARRRAVFCRRARLLAIGRRCFSQLRLELRPCVLIPAYRYCSL